MRSGSGLWEGVISDFDPLRSHSSSVRRFWTLTLGVVVVKSVNQLGRELSHIRLCAGLRSWTCSDLENQLLYQFHLKAP